MTLREIADGATAVPQALIGADASLSREVQDRLSAHGILDPPADGAFGPVSLWAMTQFLRRVGTPGKMLLDAEAAQALLSAEPVFPLRAPDTLAGRVVQAMQTRGHWIARHPDCVNVVYVEGIDPDGTRNTDAPNEFNDLRLVFQLNRAGSAQITDAWEATTEPGRHFTLNKLDPLGAARIAFGQYKAWSVGTHKGGSQSTPHEALVQTASIRVHRDLNEDFERDGDKVFAGLFGINQHWGFDMPRSDIGRASAGCLVGRARVGHRAFMTLCKSDPRFTANQSYRFVTTVLPADDLPPA